ncbi:ABC transporter substrate-binding protein [Virgibacillus sp. SK37]|uniref:ABC transporter substrate-binding protein n=1 Tax=Virgibacillus sp. SK37 TaxID=403957 RepID=UPI001B30C240|nr:ABC transporter substrate-binding protein [Virgibacillus sp. SK37]
MKGKKLILLSFVFLVGMLLTACGSEKLTSSEGESSKSNKLPIYTAFPEQEAVTYIQEFEKETGIDVQFVRLSAGETLARLQAEKSNPQASVWYGGPSDTFVAAVNEGLIEAYQPEGIDQLPEQFLDKEEHWTPIYVGALGFATNQDWLKKEGLEAPKSWSDLLKPEFAGEVTMAHPSSSGTAYSIYATLVQLIGEDEAIDYLKKLDKNIRQYTKSGSAPAQQTGLGETGVGISFAHDILAPKHEGYPIELTFPEDGTGYEVGAVALIKNAPADQLENAKKFIDWSITKAAQDIYSESESFRLPINPEAITPEGATKLTELEIIDYDAVWAGENRDRLLEKFNKEVRGQDAAE